MTDDQIQNLLDRVQRLEDEQAIARLIASYGPLVDAGRADDVAELWATDGVYDVEGWLMRSREDVRAMVNSDQHQGLVKHGCVHFHSPAVVYVDGDSAVATCETLLVLRRGRGEETKGFSVLRGGATRIRLIRDSESPHGWSIAERVTHLLDGSDEGRDLLAQARPPRRSENA